MESKDIISTLTNLPTAEEDADLHNFLKNPEYKRIALILLLAQTRSSCPEGMTKKAMACKLSQIYAFHQLLDFPDIVDSWINGKKEIKENELPEEEL